jgi:hypothetical protein
MTTKLKKNWIGHEKDENFYTAVLSCQRKELIFWRVGSVSA